MNEIRRDASGSLERPRRGRRKLGLILLPAALLAIAAGGFALMSAEDVLSAGIGCYDAPDTGAGATIVAADGRNPVKVCADLWEDGVIGAGTATAPALTACVNEPGGVLVFPTADAGICGDEGLQELPPGYEREAKRFVAMRDDVVRALYRAGAGDADPAAGSGDDACLDEATALAVVRDVLDKHGFDDWGAEVATGDYQDRTCMNALAFEDADKTVLVIPSEPGMDPSPFAPH